MTAGGRLVVGGGGLGRRKKSGKRDATYHGLNPKTFPLSVREFIEVDYIHKLSAEEKAFLSRFNDQYHGAAYTKADQEDESAAETAARRDAYRRKNKANGDVYSLARASGLAFTSVPNFNGRGETDIQECLQSDENQDWTEPAEYLESAEYRRALARVRAHLPSNPRNKVRNTPELRAAYAALERAKKGRK